MTKTMNPLLAGQIAAAAAAADPNADPKALEAAVNNATPAEPEIERPENVLAENAADKRPMLPPKTVTPVKQIDEKAETLRRADAVLATEEEAVEEELFFFMSKYPANVVYVPYKGRIDYKVQFVRGVFSTKDPDLAAALRKNRTRGMVTYREERSIRNMAVRREAARRVETMQSPTFAGPTSSTDGAEQVYLKARSDMATLEQQLFNGQEI
jgi:hypothetical protein